MVVWLALSRRGALDLFTMMRVLLIRSTRLSLRLRPILRSSSRLSPQCSLLTYIAGSDVPPPVCSYPTLGLRTPTSAPYSGRHLHSGMNSRGHSPLCRGYMVSCLTIDLSVGLSSNGRDANAVTQQPPVFQGGARGTLPPYGGFDPSLGHRRSRLRVRSTKVSI